MMKKKLDELAEERLLILDGAMGTQIQLAGVPQDAWGDSEGCNELLNVTCPEVIAKIHDAYCKAGADIIKTNTFGALNWVLDEYNLGNRAFELARAGAEVARKVCDAHSAHSAHSAETPRFAAGSLGPGTKLPSLGHITYDEMYPGYFEAARGLIAGGVDLFLLETAQDPLQIKAALHAIHDAMATEGVTLPVMVSVTVELSGTMLIGTDAATIATILEPFGLFSLGFNCGTGPDQVLPHVKTLSEVWPGRISVHANAGLPQNRGGVTFYPMTPEHFGRQQTKLADIDGVTLLGGCCGTTPDHIRELAGQVRGRVPRPATGKAEPSLASLFETRTIRQNPAPFLIGERSNATGSKAFRELLLAQDFEGTLAVAGEQMRSGAHGLDVNVGFAGRDESDDMARIIALYNQKNPLPLMVDSTQVRALEAGLKSIGGRPIINSVNLEEGEGKFDQVCALAKRYGTALVCLTIDEEGMAKTRERKVAIGERMLQRAVTKHGLAPHDLVFDFLTFTVGSGDEEYIGTAPETIEAIRTFHALHPEVGFVLGVSNISFGLARHSREYLNSIFLHHCVEAGLSMAIINVKNILPLSRIGEAERRVCEDLLFDCRDAGDPLLAFIKHFEGVTADTNSGRDVYEGLEPRPLLKKLLADGNRPRMLQELATIREQINPEEIINDVLVGGMKEIGELFGDGKMQLPFVLQSAEVMKAAVDYLKPFLPKTEKETETTLILGTVKGDVHDVGKNLVDIILSNNGYRVVNIGIKADIQEFIEAYRENKAQAVGMSGLLVKSTAIMKENLEVMKAEGLNVPVILGGAALNREFVEEYCRTAYDGPVFYCRDAFEGILAMNRIEAGSADTELTAAPVVKTAAKTDSETVSRPAKRVRQDVPVPTPPFWGERQLKSDLLELAFEWVNHRVLFAQRWGYSGKDREREEREVQRRDLLWPQFDRLKALILRLGLFEPTMLYGYWPCRKEGDMLFIFSEEKGWLPGQEPSVTPASEALHTLQFERQKRKPYRCLTDFFYEEHDDIVAFTCVSAGKCFSEYEAELYKKGEYQEYYCLHGLGVELAEALAEIVHKQIRLDLGIAQNEGKTLRDVKLSRYQGRRYSFGYPACPELADNRIIFDLLHPERFGIELSETFQLQPEQSTTSLVCHHPDARYFGV